MKVLELKDIAGYLPYGMNFINKDGVILRMDALQVSSYNVWAHQRYVKGKKDERDINYPYLNSLHCSGEGDYLRRIKPILRPMSDLTIPIVVKGYNNDKAFVPLEVLSYTLFGAVGLIIDQKMCFGYRNEDTFYWDENDFTVNYHDSDDYINVSFLKVYDLLDQWHFDYRNLIAEGLAIDINTLNQ